jgi:NADPH-dependent glutamate synthase beta subunit-like oxidoreductase
MAIRKVAVVDAGPGGLTLARLLYCSKASIDLTVMN